LERVKVTELSKEKEALKQKFYVQEYKVSKRRSRVNKTKLFNYGMLTANNC